MFTRNAICRMSVLRRHNLRRRMEERINSIEARFNSGAPGVGDMMRSHERAVRVLGRFAAINATHAPKQ